MDKIMVQRKDGIMYEKSQRYNTEHYDCVVNFRYKLEQTKKLKDFAHSQGMGYQALIRQILDDYIETEIY